MKKLSFSQRAKLNRGWYGPLACYLLGASLGFAPEDWVRKWPLLFLGLAFAVALAAVAIGHNLSHYVYELQARQQELRFIGGPLDGHIGGGDVYPSLLCAHDSLGRRAHYRHIVDGLYRNYAECGPHCVLDRYITDHLATAVGK